MRLDIRLLTVTTVVLASLAACGDDRVAGGNPGGTNQVDTTAVSSTAVPSTAVPAPFVALTWADDGGCVVMGPNCPTYRVWSDGTVEISRTGEDSPAEVTGSIPAAQVAAWLASVADLDVETLAAAVGPGTCNSCVDGADTMLTVQTDAGDTLLDSTKLAFDPTNEFFADVERLMADVRAVGDLPLVSRS